MVVTAYYHLLEPFECLAPHILQPLYPFLFPKGDIGSEESSKEGRDHRELGQYLGKTTHGNKDVIYQEAQVIYA